MHDNYFPSARCTPIHMHVINRAEGEFFLSFCSFIDQTYVVHVGYLRSRFEYFLKGFGPVHSPTQNNFSPSRSRRVLSNQHHFNIKVHFHPPKNPQKPKKNCAKFLKIL